ncbi:RcnB family protein [Acinetobacter nectaris]|uniref:RcnB family protein n=1 Tax=Acinetobacter nectaris TaxID=1219382 RepID=UPI001F314D80|nr:RcnB family protein [Acinetobacter nectaris]MCF9046982.1 RcnB family protein [Acinetobacter nectaris]
MKKLCYILAFASDLLLVTPLYAQPHHMGGMNGNPLGQMSQGNSFSGFNNHIHQDAFQDIQEIRRTREEQGFERLKRLKWQEGYTMPQHYRSDRYKVNYNQYNLPRPERDQQWYRINNDFLLIDATNSIISVQ